MKLESLMWLLVVVFMVHDFEEIIMMRPWMDRNAGELHDRLPVRMRRFLPYLERLSTSAYALAVLVIFFFISLAVMLSVETENYTLWAAVLIVLLAHWVLHLLSYLVYRKYVPVVITSLVSIPYCVYGLYSLGQQNIDFTSGLIAYVILVVVAGAVIFVGAMWIANRFEGWLRGRT